MSASEHAGTTEKALLNTGVGRVAVGLLRHEYDTKRMSSPHWRDYGPATQEQLILRARQLVLLYTDGPPEDGERRMAQALLLHDYEHNRASTPGWDDLARTTQEQYRLHAHQLARLHAGETQPRD